VHSFPLIFVDVVEWVESGTLSKRKCVAVGKGGQRKPLS